MPTESSSAERQDPEQVLSASSTFSDLEGPVDLWITSLLPTGSTGLCCGYVDNLLLPTYPQPCKSIAINKRAPKEVLESL
jgi:hypothetical protein